MGDFEAFPLEAVPAPERSLAGRMAEAREFATGLLVTAAIAVVATVLLTAGLLVVVVASPIIAAGLAYLVMRHRPEGFRAPRRSGRNAW